MRFSNYSKYHNKRCELDGIKFHSVKEMKRYQDLKLMEKAGEICALKLQVKFPLWVEGELITTYIADFTYYEKGIYIVEDTKGVRTRDYKIKKNLLWALSLIAIRET